MTRLVGLAVREIISRAAEMFPAPEQKLPFSDNIAVAKSAPVVSDCG
jgi:hypothetical protein